MLKTKWSRIQSLSYDFHIEMKVSVNKNREFFDVLLTVHLSTILATDQLKAQIVS